MTAARKRLKSIKNNKSKCRKKNVPFKFRYATRCADIDFEYTAPLPPHRLCACVCVCREKIVVLNRRRKSATYGPTIAYACIYTVEDRKAGKIKNSRPKPNPRPDR